MVNLIRRLFNRNKPNQGQVPEFFEVPYLRDGDVPSAVLLSSDMIRSICSVRVTENYQNPQLRNVYFDARNSKGEMFPIIQYSKRTPEEARQLAAKVVSAMRNWCEHKAVVIVIDTKAFNKAA